MPTRRSIPPPDPSPTDDGYEPPMTAEPFLPPRKTMPALKKAVQLCRGCCLYKNATQAVFGEGPKDATCIMIGEQPGNDEDLKGAPFVGPAGRILDKGLKDAGIERDKVYVTNAVKHFKNEIRGARRLHRSPDTSEINACRPWLEQELKVTKPKVVICMGTSAARAVMGKKVTLRDVRGKFIESQYSDHTLITTHPSSILRSPDDESRHRNYNAFVADLKVAAKEL
jgi:DNA polymerase